MLEISLGEISNWARGYARSLHPRYSASCNWSGAVSGSETFWVCVCERERKQNKE